MTLFVICTNGQKLVEYNAFLNCKVRKVLIIKWHRVYKCFKCSISFVFYLNNILPDICLQSPLATSP
jgi:hypothetical protein